MGSGFFSERNDPELLLAEFAEDKQRKLPARVALLLERNSLIRAKIDDSPEAFVGINLLTSIAEQSKLLQETKQKNRRYLGASKHQMKWERFEEAQRHREERSSNCRKRKREKS